MARTKLLARQLMLAVPQGSEPLFCYRTTAGRRWRKRQRGKAARQWVYRETIRHMGERDEDLRLLAEESRARWAEYEASYWDFQRYADDNGFLRAMPWSA